jgi:acyl-CoA dehydrogenase
VDFADSARTSDLKARVRALLDDHVLPAESRFERERAEGELWTTPPVMEELKATARSLGLWNLFLPGEHGAGLTNLEYAPLAEISGWSPWLAPEAMNCSAPDTGNMEILAHFATPAVRERWLRPLLDGDIRSAFSMTEPDVASSDASNIATRITEERGGFRVSGTKWWSSGAMNPRCRVAIVMGRSNDGEDRRRRHTMLVVPLDIDGVTIERSTPVFGYMDSPHGGHAVIHYKDVFVPRDHLVGELHGGFAVAQARLGPGRIHHAMRLIGMAERAFELMCLRAVDRYAFGKPLAAQGVVRDWIAESRIRIEQCRLLVLKTAWLMDTVGNHGAAMEIAAIKVAAPAMATWVIDRAIQTYGGMGLSQDVPLGELYAQARMLQIADGPDEVHKMTLARRELRQVEAQRARRAGQIV